MLRWVASQKSSFVGLETAKTSMFCSVPSCKAGQTELHFGTLAEKVKTPYQPVQCDQDMKRCQFHQSLHQYYGSTEGFRWVPAQSNGAGFQSCQIHWSNSKDRLCWVRQPYVKASLLMTLPDRFSEGTEILQKTMAHRNDEILYSDLPSKDTSITVAPTLRMRFSASTWWLTIHPALVYQYLDIG